MMTEGYFAKSHEERSFRERTDLLVVVRLDSKKYHGTVTAIRCMIFFLLEWKG
jgi:hypothetical protein